MAEGGDHTVMARLEPVKLGEPPWYAEVADASRHPPKKFVLGAGSWIIGRAEDAHIRLAAEDVSRNHASLEAGSEGLRLTDLTGKSRTKIDGQIVEGSCEVHGEAVVLLSTVRLDVKVKSSALTAVEARSSEAETPLGLVTITIPGKEPFSLPVFPGHNIIGRRDDVEIAIPTHDVSRAHAQLEATKEGLIIEDLGSANGTKVKDKKISGPTQISWADEVAVGSCILRFEAKHLSANETVMLSRRDLDRRLALARLADDETSAVPLGVSSRVPMLMGIGILLMVLAGIAWLWTNRQSNGDAVAEGVHEADMQPVDVYQEPAPPPMPAGPQPLMLQGRVEANRLASLSFRMDGIIRAVNVQIGDTVAKGDVLVDVYNKTMGEMLRRASEDFKKKRRLRAKGLILASEVEYAKAAYQDAVKQYREVKIIAPFAGTVARVSAHSGALAEPGSHAVDVMDASRILVKTGIDPGQMNAVKEGQRVEIMSADGMHQVHGAVSMVALVPDPMTGQVPVEIVVDADGAQHLLVGTPASVTIPPPAVEGDAP